MSDITTLPPRLAPTAPRLRTALLGLLLSLDDWGAHAREAWQLLLAMALANRSLAAVLVALGRPGVCRALRARLHAFLAARSLAAWEQRLNEALAARAAPLLAGQAVTVVGDACNTLFWGEVTEALAGELRGVPAQAGTTRAFTYVTLCALWRGQRLVLGLARWPRDEPLAAPLMRLLDPWLARGLRVKVVLLDRGAAHAEVFRVLSERGLPFAVPAPRRGAKAGVAALLGGLEAQWGFQPCPPPAQALDYRLQPAVGEPVDLCLLVGWERVRPRRGQRRQRSLRRSQVREGQRWRAVAWFTDGGDWRGRGQAVQKLYARRASIESSYRMSHRCRGRTCSRNPVLRLVLFALSLLLQNEWVWWRRGWERGPTAGAQRRRARQWRFVHCCFALLEHMLRVLRRGHSSRCRAPAPQRAWAGLGG